jgi:GDP-L-fucose synthase
MVGRNLRDHPGLQAWEVAAPSRSDLNLQDFPGTLDFIRSFRPDVIVHAAGRVGGIQANINNPTDFLVVNTDIGRNIVLAAKACGVERLLNLGSSCMYPRDRDHAMVESEVLTGALEPTNEGYALAKIFTQRLCSYVRRENPALLYKTLLPCNLYGRYDSFSPEKSHLVPAVIRKIHEARRDGKLTVEIWGDGTARREFMFAADLSDAIVRAITSMDSLPDLMNIGLGHDHSIHEYYATVAGVVGWSGEFVFNLDRPTGMQRKLIDISLQSEWGWAPSTSLTEGIRLTYDHFLSEVE